MPGFMHSFCISQPLRKFITLMIILKPIDRFINRDGIDFSDAHNMQPVQVTYHCSLQQNSLPCLASKIFLSFSKEWELAENLQGVLEYQTRWHMLNNFFCRSATLLNMQKISICSFLFSS